MVRMEGYAKLCDLGTMLMDSECLRSLRTNKEKEPVVFV